MTILLLSVNIKNMNKILKLVLFTILFGTVYLISGFLSLFVVGLWCSDKCGLGGIIFMPIAGILCIFSSLLLLNYSNKIFKTYKYGCLFIVGGTIFMFVTTYIIGAVFFT